MWQAFKKAFVFGVVALMPLAAVGGPTLRIVDEAGQPVGKFAVITHTADQGYNNWQSGFDGKFDLLPLKRRYAKSAAIDVVVRAEGFASVARSFAGAAKDELVATGTELVLDRGREVRLKLQPPTGKELPEGLMPQVYFPELAWRVEIMWQPENSRIEAPDFNMLNVRAAQDGVGEFEFRLPREARDFIVAIHHPGWLRFYKAGPFSSADFVDGSMALEIPKPATIAAQLAWGDRDVADLPFTGVRYQLLKQMHEGGNSYLSAASEQRGLTEPSMSVADLAPGSYMLQAVTEPKKADDPVAGTEINPGRFFARKMIELDAGQVASVRFDYVPFDAEANRGERTVRICVLGADGSPAAGKRLKVSWFDGHYGSLTVFDGPTPADGIVVLDGISDAVPTESPFGPYSIEVDGDSIGFFRVKPETGPQEFVFRLVPKAGDMAPDVEFVALETGERLRLRELRGKVVFLEFWETGCGPCQPMMAKLNELMGRHDEEWQENVAVLAVSLDANPEIVASHVKSRGWNNLRHFWSRRGSGEYFADAALAFVVHGVPTALLIDRDGKVVWRGHPMGIDLAEEVAKLGAE